VIEVEYRLRASALCPVDGSRDWYDLRVRSDVVIPVERILEVAEAAEGERVFQEVLTEQMAKELNATVVSDGVHSGVATHCEAQP
jgi:hypothetical protein